MLLEMETPIIQNITMEALKATQNKGSLMNCC